MPNEPLSFEDYKLAAQSDKHFDLMHPDGSLFKVAKKGLGDDMITAVSSLPPASPLGQPVAQQPAAPAAEPPPFVNPFFNLGMFTEGIPKIAKAVGPFPGIRPPEPDPTLASNAPVGVLPGQPTPGLAPGQSVPLDQTIGAAPQAPAAAAAAPPVDSGTNAAFAQMQKGITGAATAAEAAAKAQASAYDEQVKAMNELNARIEKERAPLIEQNMKLYQDVMNDKVDPQRYMANMSTGNKIMAGIALALGGLAGGLDKSGRNPALEVIQKTIEQDIEAQKRNLDRKNTLLSINLAQTRNLDEAAARTMAQMMSLTAARVEQAKATAAGPAARAQADSLLGELKLKQAALVEDLAKKRALNQAISGEQNVNPEVLRTLGDQGKDLAERQIVLPNGKQVYARRADDVKDLTTEIGTIQPIFQQLEKLEKIGASAMIPGSAGSREATAIMVNIGNLLKENQNLAKLFQGAKDDKIGVFNQFDDPREWKNLLGNAKENQNLREFLMQKLEGKLAAKLSNYQKPFRPKTEQPLVAKR